MPQLIEIRPQKGFQEAFLASPADIVIGGGAAGAGKSFALLLEAARNIKNPNYGAVIFRRTYQQIKNEGALWDASTKIYSLAATQRETDLTWRFPSGATISFSHMQHEKNVLDHQGTEYPFIGFDELTHFSEKMFFYLLSRNRSTCGVKPYVRATCNPDPGSWVAKFIEWWIDPITGFPIPERSGVLRYFTRDDNTFVWGDTAQEVVDKCPHLFGDMTEQEAIESVKSVTFIPGSIFDNQKLLSADKGYLANLRAQDPATRAALLEGNWKERPDDLCLFNIDAIHDLLHNHPPNDRKRYITCDVARHGRDFAVIATWEGFKVIKLQVYTQCTIPELHKAIEDERKRMNIPPSHVIVDQDGVGGGLMDMGRYKGFTSNATPMPGPVTKEKENYANLKTQCYYRFADRLNAQGAAVDENEIWVDGARRSSVKAGSKEQLVTELIKADLRSAKRDKVDQDGKRQMIRKEAQKNLLGGRSPDFGDTLVMREWFELQPRNSISW